jgi:hypothetical protein
MLTILVAAAALGGLGLLLTLVEVSGASSTIVFPVPIDLMSAGAGPSAQQMQAAMQSAVALAATQRAGKQLAAGGERDDRLEAAAAAPKVPLRR